MNTRKTAMRHCRIIAALATLSVLACLTSALAAAEPLPPRLPHTSSWLGNSFGIYGKAWVQNWIDDLYVLPDGTCCTNSGWEEGGANAQMYRDGAILANPGFTHGWGHGGGSAVTASAAHLFLAQSRNNEGGQLFDRDPRTWPPKGKKWFGVSRRQLAAPGQSAPFTGGVGGEHLANGFLVVNECVADDARPNLAVSALAVDAKNRLLVAVPLSAEIRLYDAASMAALGVWKDLPRLARMAGAADGSVWAIQLGATSGAPSRIIHIDAAGAVLPQRIEDVTSPTCLAFDRQGRLMVGDRGPALQVRTYTDLATTPRCVETFGVKGGIFSGRSGELKPDKLLSIEGVGMDAKGNRYVASSSFGSGTDLRSFAPDGKLLWNLLDPMFVDMIGIDPADPGQAWGVEERYSLDWSKQKPGSEWSYQAFTCDHFRYPEDIRKSDRPANVWVRRIGGKPILFMTNMYSSYLAVYRIDPTGEIAIPAGMIGMGRMKNWSAQQPEGAYLWRDGNADGRPQPTEFSEPTKPGAVGGTWGWAVAPNGDIWQAVEGQGLRHLPCHGLDAAGVPQYVIAEQVIEAQPAPFNRVQRLEYDGEHDVMYIGGFTAARPAPKDNWGMVGTVLARYDRWSTGNRTATWTTALPWGDSYDLQPKSMCHAGDYLFVVNLGRGPVFVIHAATASLVGIMAPGPEVGSGCGLIDIPHGIQAVKLPNGEYAVFVEEDGNGKVLIFRWKAAFSPPVAKLILPASAVEAGKPLTLTATVAPGSSPVTRVEFWRNDEKLGEATAAPWAFAWPVVAAGRNRMSLRVYDAAGAVTPIPPVTIDVGIIGKLWVDWDPKINGWWEAGGILGGTGRIAESRAFPTVPIDCDLRFNCNSGSFDVAIRDGVVRQITAPGIGVQHVTTNHLSFAPRIMVVDSTGYAGWTQLEGAEGERIVGRRRELLVIPGPYTLTGEFGRAAFTVTLDGKLVVGDGASILRVKDNNLLVGAP